MPQSPSSSAHINKQTRQRQRCRLPIPSEDTNIENGVDKHIKSRESEPRSLTIETVVDDHTPGDEVCGGISHQYFPSSSGASAHSEIVRGHHEKVKHL